MTNAAPKVAISSNAIHAPPTELVATPVMAAIVVTAPGAKFKFKPRAPKSAGHGLRAAWPRARLRGCRRRPDPIQHAASPVPCVPLACGPGRGGVVVHVRPPGCHAGGGGAGRAW